MNRHALPLLALLAPFGADAAAPALVPVTGYLTDEAGAPIDATVDLSVGLYVDATTTEALWTEVQSVDVDNGQFTIYLGAQEPLTLALFRDNANLQLGISIDDAAEMSPRFAVATAPFAAYAQYSDDAATVGGIDPADLRLTSDVLTWSDLDPASLPADLADGDADTTYLAGAGLPLTSDTFAADKGIIEGWATGVAYDTLTELRGVLDAVYAGKQACVTNQVLVADASGAWLCTDAAALPVNEAAVDAAVANNGYALGTALTALTTRVTATEGRLTTAEGRIATAEGKITAAEGRLTTAEGKIATAEGKITAAETRITSAEGRLTTAEGRITTANTAIAAATTSITATNTAVTALTGRVTTAEGKITAMQPTGIHDHVFQYSTTDNNAIPLQLKTQWRTNNSAMYRVTVQGYAYGSVAAVNSDCVGYLYSATDTIINATCNNYAPGGVTLAQYKTTDGYLAFELRYPSSYYLGIDVGYSTLSPTGNFNTTFTAFKQTARL